MVYPPVDSNIVGYYSSLSNNDPNQSNNNAAVSQVAQQALNPPIGPHQPNTDESDDEGVCFTEGDDDCCYKGVLNTEGGRCTIL